MRGGMTIAVRLPQELEEFVETSIRSGRYAGEEAVMLEALEALRHREAVEELRAKLRAGVEDFEQGRCGPWDAAA